VISAVISSIELVVGFLTCIFNKFSPTINDFGVKSIIFISFWDASLAKIWIVLDAESPSASFIVNFIV